MVDPADRDVLNKRLAVWKGPPPGDFARHPDTLLRMCEAADADTVVVDSLKDVALKLTDDETVAALNSAHQRTVVAGVQLLALHHQRKRGADGGKPTTLDDVYGSVWIAAGAGSVLLLWGAPGDPIVELNHLKQPAEPVGPLKVLHDAVTGASGIFEQVDILDLARTKNGVTAADVAKVLFEVATPDRNQTEKARRRLDQLTRQGVLHCRPGSRGGASSVPSMWFPVSRQEEGR